MGAALGREVVDNDLHPFGQRAVTAVAIDKTNRVTNITSFPSPVIGESVRPPQNRNLQQLLFRVPGTGSTTIYQVQVHPNGPDFFLN